MFYPIRFYTQDELLHLKGTISVILKSWLLDWFGTSSFISVDLMNSQISEKNLGAMNVSHRGLYYLADESKNILTSKLCCSDSSQQKSNSFSNFMIADCLNDLCTRFNFPDQPFDYGFEMNLESYDKLCQVGLGSIIIRLSIEEGDIVFLIHQNHVLDLLPENSENKVTVPTIKLKELLKPYQDNKLSFQTRMEIFPIKISEVMSLSVGDVVLLDAEKIPDIKILNANNDVLFAGKYGLFDEVPSIKIKVG